MRFDQSLLDFFNLVDLRHTDLFHGPLSGTIWVSRYQKGKTNLDFTEARDSEWQWHQLGGMQVCTSFQTDNHASTPPLSFLQAGCPSCHPTNSVKALKASNCQRDFSFRGESPPDLLTRGSAHHPTEGSALSQRKDVQYYRLVLHTRHMAHTTY